MRADSCALSQVQEKIVEMTQFILHGRTVEQIADVPGTQIQAQFLEVVKIISQERIQQDTVEQIFHVSRTANYGEHC